MPITNNFIASVAYGSGPFDECEVVYRENGDTENLCNLETHGDA